MVVAYLESKVSPRYLTVASCPLVCPGSQTICAYAVSAGRERFS